MNAGKTILLLICSNIFMTFAWYAHLKNLNQKAIWIAILASWGLAFFEYLFQVPANRIGFSTGTFSLVQLKVLQEIITLAVFFPFAVLYYVLSAQPISYFVRNESDWKIAALKIRATAKHMQ